LERKIYLKDYQLNNLDKYRVYGKERQHKNHDITDEQWIGCKNYFGNTCAYCDLPLEQHWVEYAGKMILGDFHKEHAIHNGANDLGNCVPSCKSCNSSKWEYDLDDWYNENNHRFTIEKYNKIKQWLNVDYKLFLKE
jgi:hypothetical protein